MDHLPAVSPYNNHLKKKGVCKIDEVYVCVVSSTGRGRLLFWHLRSHEAVQIQVNISVFPICCCKQGENCQERSSKVIWVMICSTLGAWRGSPPTVNITFRVMWYASFVCTIDYVSKGPFFPSTPKQLNCLITHKDPELTQRDCSQTPCGIMNSPYRLLQHPLRRSLWKAPTVHARPWQSQALSVIYIIIKCPITLKNNKSRMQPRSPALVLWYTVACSWCECWHIFRRSR